MRATLLLTTLLFGAPLPDEQPPDPSSEVRPAKPGLAEITTRLVELSAPLLRCATRDEFFTTLDSAVLRLDLSALALATLTHSTHGDPAVDLEHLRAEAARQVEAIVGPAWRAELRAGLAQASRANTYADHPAIVGGLETLAEEDAPEIHEIFGDMHLPLGERRTLLRYFHGLLCAGALAAAAGRGEHLPDRLAALIIPLWRDTLRQVESVVQTGALRQLAEVHQDTSPLAELMLRFQCRDGEPIDACLRADPTLAALLIELHAQVMQHFPADALAAVKLTPTWSADEAEEPGLLVAIHTSQDLEEAEASLARLDHAWWLERSLQAATRVVVDVRFS